MNDRTSPPARSRAYLNAVLTAIALLLAAVLFQNTTGAPALSEASADTRGSGGLANPADQRREMINELKRVNDRLERLSREIKAPIEVEVVRMPSTESGD